MASERLVGHVCLVVHETTYIGTVMLWDNVDL